MADAITFGPRGPADLPTVAALLGTAPAGPVGWVARDGAGRVVAHAALLDMPLAPAVLRFGQAVTAPGWRGRGVMRQLLPALAAEAEAQAEESLALLPVQRTGLQRLFLARGYQPVALLLAPTAAAARLLVAQRHRATPQRLHLPEPHAGDLLMLATGFEAGRAYAEPSPAPPALAASRLAASPEGLCVLAIGADLAEAGGPGPGTLFLPLTDPAIGWAIAVLQARGWSLAGLAPRWLDADALVLQRLAAPPDTAALRLHGAKSGRLLALVDADRRTVPRSANPA